MFAHERQHAILQKIKKEKNVKVSELLDMFQVSFETMRRDLDFLEKQGVIKRFHGGAAWLEDDYRQELPLAVRELKHTDEKHALAEKAATLVSEGQSIFLDVSTTNTEFAKVLKTRFQRLTVLTNSFPIAELLMSKPDFTIIFVGGVVRNQEKCVVGDLAEAFVSQFRTDLFFMSASGVSLENGVTDYGAGEVQLKKKVLAFAGKTIVLADSSKIDAVSLLHICGLDSIGVIVTDPDIDTQIARKYTDSGIEIVY